MGTVETYWHEEGRIAEVVLDRPAVRNALSRATVDEIISAIESGQGAHCIVLRSTGNVFCSGADRREAANLAQVEANEADMKQLVEGKFQSLIRTIRESAPPVIGQVQGAAFGGGADLALACDIRIAGRSAWLEFAWIRFGLITPLGGAHALVNARGSGFALHSLLSSRRFDASECLEFGLFQQVVPDEELDICVWQFALELSRRAREAVIGMKEIVRVAEVGGFEESLKIGLDVQGTLLSAASLASIANAKNRTVVNTGELPNLSSMEKD